MSSNLSSLVSSRPPCDVGDNDNDCSDNHQRQDDERVMTAIAPDCHENDIDHYLGSAHGIEEHTWAAYMEYMENPHLVSSLPAVLCTVRISVTTNTDNGDSNVDNGPQRKQL